MNKEALMSKILMRERYEKFNICLHRSGYGQPNLSAFDCLFYWNILCFQEVLDENQIFLLP